MQGRTEKEAKEKALFKDHCAYSSFAGEFATDINNVMYAYIDRKKKLPVGNLLFSCKGMAATVHALLFQDAAIMLRRQP